MAHVNLSISVNYWKQKQTQPQRNCGQTERNMGTEKSGDKTEFISYFCSSGVWLLAQWSCLEAEGEERKPKLALQVLTRDH